jgi:hypothetical protein
MQEKASATFCFTCVGSHNLCEKNQNARITYHVWGEKWPTM